MLPRDNLFARRVAEVNQRRPQVRQKLPDFSFLRFLRLLQRALNNSKGNPVGKHLPHPVWEVVRLVHYDYGILNALAGFSQKPFTYLGVEERVVISNYQGSVLGS